MTDAVRYLCVVRLDGADRIFLWEDDDPGPARIVVDGVTFPDEIAARQAAEVSPDEAWIQDLDAIETWCRTAAPIRECRPLLDAWNLLVDLPGGESTFRAADARALGAYDKLFHGCNLPAMTPPGAHDEPVWTAFETAAVKRVLLLGLAELRARLR